jgi:hypothetical protein
MNGLLSASLVGVVVTAAASWLLLSLLGLQGWRRAAVTLIAVAVFGIAAAAYVMLLGWL